MKKKKTYKIDTHCRNCKVNGTQEIEVGRRAFVRLESIECPECGCLELIQRSLRATPREECVVFVIASISVVATIAIACQIGLVISRFI